MNNYEYNELLKLGSLLQAKNELDPEIKKLDFKDEIIWDKK